MYTNPQKCVSPSIAVGLPVKIPQILPQTELGHLNAFQAYQPQMNVLNNHQFRHSRQQPNNVRIVRRVVTHIVDETQKRSQVFWTSPNWQIDYSLDAAWLARTPLQPTTHPNTGTLGGPKMHKSMFA